MADQVILVPGSQTQLSDGSKLTIDNPASETGYALNILGAYAQERIQYNRQLKIETMTTLISAIAQMFIYWLLFENMLDKRDDTLDKMLNFIKRLRARAKDKDLPILKLKADAINIPEPELDMCASSKLFEEETQKDGKQLDKINLGFGKIPDGWGLHYGWLASALAAGTVSSYATYANKMRYYTFMTAKAKLLVRAQTSMKSVYNAQGILGYYQQAARIYSGLTDIFIQGFNSGGAALGTALGRMSGMSSSGTNSQRVIQIGDGLAY